MERTLLIITIVAIVLGVIFCSLSNTYAEKDNTRISGVFYWISAVLFLIAIGTFLYNYSYIKSIFSFM